MQCESLSSVADAPMSDLMSALKSVFGFSTFRPHQEEIVRALLGRRDLFAVMPTGGGKSLCYQLPALLMPGVCLVISPLISLMKDQVDAAQAIGLKAAFLNSSQGAADRNAVMQSLKTGGIDLLYVSPERFAMPAFTALLRTVPLAFVAIDEAHCISEWGHDFRPDYLQLAEIVRLFPDCPVAAFTATATRRVEQDIIAKLGLREPYRVRASFNRPNLFYQVLPKTDPDRQLLDFVRARRGEQGIIYRTTRKSVESTAAMLNSNGIRALPYHAGLEDRVRVANQEAFNRDETDVVVATIAFGMGIDKSNVRYVAHGDLPKNIEGYYQETGRAGRDGDPAHCLLLFGYGDIPKITHFLDEITDETARRHARSCLDEMVRYGSARACRRKQLLAYFNEQYPQEDCGMCDVCAGEVEEADATVEAQMLMSAIVRTGNRFGAGHIIDIVTGADTQKVRQFDHDQLKTFGVGKDKSKRHFQAVVGNLLAQGLLQQSGDRYPVLQVTPRAGAVLEGKARVRIIKPVEKAAPRKAAASGDMPCHAPLFDALRALRKQIAEKQGVPPFVVFSDRTLREMSARMPSDGRELQGVGGVGTHKLAQYGTAFLEAIRAFRQEHPDAQPLVEETLFIPPPPPTLSRGDTIMETAVLLEKGLGIEEVAAQRGLKPTTIINHIEQLIGNGHPVDLGPLVDLAKLEPVLAVLRQSETAALKPVVEQFEGRITYDDVRLARAWLAANARQDT
jgi:ATP-dependent DNA helicase RecQ